MSEAEPLTLSELDRREAERLRAENAMLRAAFCDEAYILTEQALRMARVGLGEGYPRHTTYISARLSQLARVVIEQLSPPSDEADAA